MLRPKLITTVVLVLCFCLLPAGPSRAVLIEAEDERDRSLISSDSREESSLPHSGSGYWRLAAGDEWLAYDFQVTASGKYDIWVKNHGRAQEPPSQRGFVVEVDGQPATGVNGFEAGAVPAWGWTLAAKLELTPGSHALRLTKTRGAKSDSLRRLIGGKRAECSILIDQLFIGPEGQSPPPIGPGNPPPPPSGREIARGDVQPRTEGVIRVNDPGGSLDGMNLTVPAGSFGSPITVAISTRPMPLKGFAPGDNPVTPLIRIDHGPDPGKLYMALEIPLNIPAGSFAMPFFRDEKTGQLELITVVRQDSAGLTMVASNYDRELYVSLEPDPATAAFASDRIATGWKVQQDGWRFTNEGSVVSPGGICAGMTLGAMWYYRERTKRGATPLHYAGFETYDYPFKTPGYQWDDKRAIKFASMIQKDHDVWDKKWSQLSNWRDRDPAGFDRITWRCFAYAFKKVGRPVYVSVRRISGGHALIAYAMSLTEKKLYVYDPNYSFREERFIEYTPAGFKPYRSAANAKALKASGGRLYDRIFYLARTGWANDPIILKHWKKLRDGTVGQGDFPGYHFKVYDQANKVLAARLSNGLATSEEKIYLGVRGGTGFTFNIVASEQVVRIDPPPPKAKPNAGSEPKLRTKPAGAKVVSGKIEIPLSQGENMIGIRLNARKSTSTGDTGWAGFDWYRITREGPMITPLKGIINIPLTLTVNVKNPPAGATYVWYMGPTKTKQGTGATPSVSFKPDKAGPYPVKVEVYKGPVKGKPVTVAEAKIEIEDKSLIKPEWKMKPAKTNPNWVGYSLDIQLAIWKYKNKVPYQGKLRGYYRSTDDALYPRGRPWVGAWTYTFSSEQRAKAYLDELFKGGVVAHVNELGRKNAAGQLASRAKLCKRVDRHNWSGPCMTPGSYTWIDAISNRYKYQADFSKLQVNRVSEQVKATLIRTVTATGDPKAKYEIRNTCAQHGTFNNHVQRAVYIPDGKKVYVYMVMGQASWPVKKGPGGCGFTRTIFNAKFPEHIWKHVLEYAAAYREQ